MGREGLRMVDVNMYFGVQPAALIPVSDRAKLLLSLPDNVDGVIINDEPQKVLSVFPEDYVMGQTETPPKIVAITGLEVLH